MSMRIAYHSARSLLRVEVGVTACVVSHPPVSVLQEQGQGQGQGQGKAQRICALINPGNNRMVGTDLPYFPVGGPVPDIPKENNAWGGMEIGPNQVYASQAVDGQVTGLGGRSLQRALRALPFVDESRQYRCHVGGAVLTDATEGLRGNFRHIIHTVPPFFSASDERMGPNLKACYSTSVRIAFELGMEELASPLLGGGARGIPAQQATALALQALAEDVGFVARPMVLRFGVQEDSVLKMFDAQFRKQYKDWRPV